MAKIDNNILNSILRHLESSNQPVVISSILKKMGIEDVNTVKLYEIKLESDGYINLKSFSSDRKHATISDEGRLFINDGGYPIHSENKSKMTKEQIKNIILREMHDEGIGKIVSDVFDDLGLQKDPVVMKEIEVELYRDGFVTTSKLPDGVKVLHINEKGYDFISNGGYKSDTQKHLEDIVKSSYKNWGKNHQEKLKPHEIKIVYQKLQAVFDELIHKIGVVSDDELKLTTAPLGAAYEQLYGKTSDEFLKCNSITKDVATCRKEILPFLKDTLTRLELKFQLTDLDLHPKIKAVSEKLFIDGHYKQAVLDAFIFLENEVQRITGISKIGKPLMDETFSENNPKIHFSTDKGEQTGMMFLYGAAMMGIRNRYAHKTITLTDKNYALDLLHFASALIRLIENKSIY